MIIDVKLALFYMFSAIVVTASLNVVISRHPVKAVLSLVLAFVASSVLWLLLSAEFLALALIVVYVGAVMVLLLFVVMMLDVDIAAERGRFIKKFPLVLLLSGGLFIVFVYVFGSGYFNTENYKIPTELSAEYNNIQALGLELFTKYIYSFELAGAILTVALIAAISLAYRGPKTRKVQDINNQVKACKKQRLKIIKDL